MPQLCNNGDDVLLVITSNGITEDRQFSHNPNVMLEKVTTVIKQGEFYGVPYAWAISLPPEVPPGTVITGQGFEPGWRGPSWLAIEGVGEGTYKFTNPYAMRIAQGTWYGTLLSMGGTNTSFHSTGYPITVKTPDVIQEMWTLKVLASDGTEIFRKDSTSEITYIYSCINVCPHGTVWNEDCQDCVPDCFPTFLSITESIVSSLQAN